MNILFTICGRAGSKGFKNKNLKIFSGIPLVYYSIAAIALYIEKNSERNDFDIVLNTDSEELINIVLRQSEVLTEVIHRDTVLGGDEVPKIAVIKDCLLRMEEKKCKSYDIVVDLDITSPLRTLPDIENAIRQKKFRPDTDVVFSVTEARRNPYFNMVKKDGRYFSKAISSEYTARQQAPAFYDMNASIYAYDVEALKSKDSKIFFNDKCDVILMKDTGILDIDSEEDFQLMQVIAEYLFENHSDFKEVYQKAEHMLKNNTQIKNEF